VLRLGDDEPAHHAHDALRLPQHDLYLARVLIPCRRELGGQRGRLDRTKVDEASLCLGYDLVRHHNDIPLLKMTKAAADRFCNERGELITCLNLWQAVHRQDRDRSIRMLRHECSINTG
jgi:hypothetical protein